VNGEPKPDRPDLVAYERADGIQTLIAAGGNAIFGASGVRIRRVPFRHERVLAVLKAAGMERRYVILTRRM
jgi:hypothetical protein